MPYSGNPLASDADWVWFTIRDTSLTNPYYSDQEVLAALVEWGNKYTAAGHLLKLWVIDMLQEPNFSLGSFSENHGATLSELQKKADDLIEEGEKLTATGVGLYAGGVSVTDNRALDADTDRPAMSFTTRMMRNPRAD